MGWGRVGVGSSYSRVNFPKLRPALSHVESFVAKTPRDPADLPHRSLVKANQSILAFA